MIPKPPKSLKEVPKSLKAHTGDELIEMLKMANAKLNDWFTFKMMIEHEIERRRKWWNLEA